MRAPEASSDRIVVVGRAQRGVEADVANLVLTVVEVDSDQRAAFARCRERVNDLLPRLRDTAGAQATVTTGNLDLDRHYSDIDEGELGDRGGGWGGTGAPLRKYAASCALAVECTPEAAAPVIAEAVAAGIERLGGPRYGVRDSSPTIDGLLGKAFSDARRKARRLADAAERELGVAIVVEEGHDLREHAVAFFESSAMSRTSNNVDLQPARIEIAATVRVTFALVR